MSTYESLKDRVAIVTGGGQGLGRAFSKAFAAQGAVAVIADMNGAKAVSVAEEIHAAGGRALAIRTDVADADSVGTMAREVEAKFGRVDILINNAAIFSTLEMRPFGDIPVAEWKRVLDVNINGTYYCARALSPAMTSAGWGRIINISSASTLEGRANYLHYTTSKSALIGMTRSMARELGTGGVTVNAVLPGATFTEIERKTVSPGQMQALIGGRCIKREERPEDLIGTILFLSSEDSAFITGQSITVDGGMTHN